ncbi:MAG: alpha-mannosidase [Olsenella sp.]|nr:alpha-mannosidase [Olsenella sp.]
MGKDIHVVAHSHWDREWYFTTSRSKIYLQKDLGDVMDTLERDPSFTSFMLDGQTCLVDDYLAWNPGEKSRLMRLVREGRLIIGPWYTQTDQMVISGESIVRNMAYGIRRADELGGHMRVGYVPDSFGQAGNMPQIYAGFGIATSLFWRGVSDDMCSHTDFYWRGDDGTRTLVSQIPYGYYIGGNIPERGALSDAFWKEQCGEKAARRAATDNVYFPVGFDQAPIRTNLPAIVAERQAADPKNTYRISSLEEFMDDLQSAVDEMGGGLEEVSGELLCGKHMRIHRSIFSSRSDLKALNTELQDYIVNVMEPVLALSAHLGYEYPRGAVDALWKLMFENAAHDSIGSSVNDSVNEDIRMRYKQARDIATNLVELHARQVVTGMAGSEEAHTVTVFNTLPEKRSGVLVQRMYLPGGEVALEREDGTRVPYTVISERDLTDYVLTQTIRLDPSREIDIPTTVREALVAIRVEDVPAMGFERYRLVEGQSSQEPLHPLGAIENETYRVSVNADGSLRVECKDTGYVYERECVLMESGDDGDSFNYSPPREDMVVLSSEFEPTVRIEGSSLWQRALVRFEMLLPHDLEERAAGGRSARMPVTLEVTLVAGSPSIGIDVHVDNTQPLSHRLCALFDAQLVSRVNHADQQFGPIVRDNFHAEEMALYRQSVGAPAHPETGDRGGMPTNWVQTEGSWQEPPVSIEPTQTYVGLFDDARGLAVIPRGVREYQVLNDRLESAEEGSVVCLTLFRTYGFMGKENLLYRPGRASGEKTMETPDAQLRGEMTFSLDLAAFGSAFDDAGVAHLARVARTPLVGYEYAPFLNGRLIFSQMERVGTEPCTGSLLSVEGDLVVSAIKCADRRDGLVVRVYNPLEGREASGTIRTCAPVVRASYVNLLEEDVNPIVFEGNAIAVGPLGHCKFATIYIEF